MSMPQPQPPTASSRPAENHEVTLLTSTERARLFSGRDLWGSNGLGDRRLQCRPPDRRFVRYADVPFDGGITTLPVSHVGVTHVAADTAGLGTIVTTGDARKQGHATALIDHVLGVLADEGVRQALLLCLDHRHAYYLKRGWWDVEGEVTVDQPKGRVVVQPPYHVMWRWVGTGSWTPVAGPLTLGRPW